MWPFRTIPAPELIQPPADAKDVDIHVSADMSENVVVLDSGLIKWHLSRDGALAIASQLRRAAEALPDDAVDITQQVNEK